MVRIEVYHGTNAKNEKSIRNNGFRKSRNEENAQWLGDGVYFFCEGVPPPPYESAQKWAVAEAWNNYSKMYDYQRYVVLKTYINTSENKLWDLTERDGQEIFHYLRNKFIEYAKNNRLYFNNYEFKDAHIIDNAIEQEIIPQLDAVKANYYIKFTDERKLKIQSKMPNCTIIAVKQTSCIDNDIVTYKKGLI